MSVPYKHIIISRVAIKWLEEDDSLKCETLGLSWDAWLKQSIELYDKYCRMSLRRQTNKNFILLSIVDESVEEFGEVMDNEYIIKIKDLKEIRPTIHKFIKENISEKLYLFSRIDRDDCYAGDFVNALQTAASKYLGETSEFKPVYFDIAKLNSYDSVNNVFSIVPYIHATSPFTSILTQESNTSIYGGHHNIGKNIKGFHLPTLNTLQIIHDHNISNITYDRTIPTININRMLLTYGIKKSIGFCIDDLLYKWILKNIPFGSTILELGSGYKTIDLSNRYTMVSVENDLEWLNLAKSKYIYAPLVGSWYNKSILERELAGIKYDVILVDGPWAKLGDRTGFLNNIELFNMCVPIIIDDTHRDSEKTMCKQLSTILNRPYIEIEGERKNFSIIQ